MEEKEKEEKTIFSHIAPFQLRTLGIITNSIGISAKVPKKAQEF